MNDRIFLIGFMGSGKTHWGKRLSQKLGVPFFDLDAEIVAAEGKPITGIFAAEGEEYFRYREKDTLEKLVQAQPRFVIATGGGTPCFFNNIRFMKGQGKVIWLNTSPDVLRDRLLRERMSRPLLHNIAEHDIRSYVIRKLTERKMYYEQADVMVHEESIELEPLIERLS